LVIWTPHSSGTTKDLLGVKAWSADCAVAVGKDGVCLTYDGRSWEPAALEINEDLYDVWGPDPDEVFAVGGNLRVGGQSKVCHYRSRRWRVLPSSIQSLLLAVCGTSADDVRAVGFNGGIVERTPDGFCEITAGTNDHLFGVHAAGPDQWIVCGLGGTIRETRETSDTSWLTHDCTHNHLNDVWAAPDGTVVLVGHAGEVVRRTAGRWSSETLAEDRSLWGVDALDDTAFICGSGGLMLALPLAGGTPVSEETGTTEALFSVSCAPGAVYAVGTRGTIVMRTEPRSGR
jgi:hypothetical protein